MTQDLRQLMIAAGSRLSKYDYILDPQMMGLHRIYRERMRRGIVCRCAFAPTSKESWMINGYWYTVDL